MADSTLSVNLNLEPAAFSTAWTNYLVTKVTQGPYTVASHAATRHLGPVQNFVENCLLGFQKKTAANIISAREYGATGDGVADDTAEIQAALDAANTMGGGTVYLGAGTFKVSTPLTIYDGTHLVGAGSTVTTINYTGVDYAVVQDTPETRIYGVLLQGFKLTFDSGGLDMNSVSDSRFVDLILQANSAGTGVCARFVSTLTDKAKSNQIVACQFVDGASGLLLGPLGASNNHVLGCVFDTCTEGVHIEDGAMNTIRGCVFLDCGTISVYLEENAAGRSDGNSIESCYFDAAGTPTRFINIATAGLDYTRVIGNHFAGTAGNADVNNGTQTQAFGNTPLRAPWGVILTDVFEVDETGALTTGTVDHGGLSGLADDDHTQYPLALGTVVDNAIVTCDGTGGRALQDSVVAIDDSGNITGVADITMSDQLRIGGSTGTGAIVAAGNSGIIRISDSETDATTKYSRVMQTAYVSAQSPLTVFMGATGSTANTVWLGGGTGLGQAATSITFYTASAVNTLTGTARWQVTNGGNFVPQATAAYDIGSTSLYARTVYANSARLQDVVTDATNKNGTIFAGTYDNAHTQVCVIRASATSTANNMRFGGTTTDYAPTNITFSTAAAVNTTGTIRWGITGDGHFRPETDSLYTLGTNTLRMLTTFTDGLCIGYRDVSADEALTLAAGDGVITLNSSAASTKTATMTATSAGHIIEVRMIARTSGQYNLACTLDGASGTLTFDAAGEYAKLVYTGSVWRVLNYSGATFA